MKLNKIFAFLLLGLAVESTAFTCGPCDETIRMMQESAIDFKDRALYYLQKIGFARVDILSKLSDPVLLYNLLPQAISGFDFSNPYNINVAVINLMELRALNKRFSNLLTNQNIATILRNAGANFDVRYKSPDGEPRLCDGFNAFHIAASLTDNPKWTFKLLEFFLDAGMDINSVVQSAIPECLQNGHAALHIACEKDNVVAVDWLLKHGARTDIAAGNDNCTPLHCTIKLNLTLNTVKIVEKLLLAGADPNAIDDTGSSVLGSTIKFLNFYRSTYSHMLDDQVDLLDQIAELLRSYGAIE